MVTLAELVLPPSAAADRQEQLNHCAVKLGVPAASIRGIEVVKRSIDARSRNIRVRLQVRVFVDEDPPEPPAPAAHFHFRDVRKQPAALIAGSGPAGLFAALRLIELGIRPVIIERGKTVRDRRRDLAAIHHRGTVDPDSNYCFGEGGAGTYSDGKLYTRSGKRGSIGRILLQLVAHGADASILSDAHPHIGTNKLPQLIENIRRTIERHGGEFLFRHRLSDFIVSDGSLQRVQLEDLAGGGLQELPAQALLLATGHSARDVFELFDTKRLLIEAKPFALGVRAEHPQDLIDRIQYHCTQRDPYLPAASYSLRHSSGDRGVYSFCMCPGGIIAPAATAPGEIVVNGWSPSKRNNPFANSGIVVSVGDPDFAPFGSSGPLAALRYQQAVEQKAFAAGGGLLRAPAQRLGDFIRKKSSADLPPASYIPGLTPAILDDILPAAVVQALREGLRAFGRKMNGYDTREAVLVATESRTSSPVRIPRDNATLQHPQVRGLFPCGEGAGYAGGIVSAAIDGERCAEAMAVYLNV